MSGDFMQDWLTLWLVWVVGLAPFGLFYFPVRWFYGEETPPAGYVLLAMLLLIGSIPLGYWCYNHFHVVWR